jgi:hypothetical protein
MSTSPAQTELLERERRWTRPAGIAGVLGALAIQAGFIVNGTALDGDGSAERLLEASTGDADGQLLLGLIVAALGFILLAVPLTYLFAAARARSERVLRQMVGLGIAGALMMGAGLVANHFSYLDAADTFAASEAERAEEPAAGEDDGKQGAQEPPTEEESEDAEDEADDRARDAQREASGATLSGLLVRGGALAFAVGFLYTALWAMRTGLLTRFWGSLGMASAVVLALFFLYFFTLIWFLAIGFFLLGLWFGGRPPAWDAGRAIPWPKAGEQAGEAAEDSVEGHGRELTERSLPEAGEDDAGEPAPPSEPPRKRKRRQ